MLPARSLLYCLRILTVALLAVPGLASAQEVEAPTPPAQLPLPGALEVSARYRTLADSAVLAEREIARLANIEALAADVENAAQRREGLGALLATVTELEYVRPERITRVRDRALLEDQRLEALLGRALARTEQLGVLRGSWLERQRFWLTWRDTLRADPEFALLQPELERALARIDTVLHQVGQAIPAILAVQREIEVLRAQTQAVTQRVAAIRLGRREALLRRDQPVLFSAPFLIELREQPWREWHPVPAAPAGTAAAFFLEHGALLVIHLLLAVVLGLIARRLRAVARPEEPWWGMLRHPWAVGVFAATTLVARRYGLAPPLWDVVIWSLLAGSGAVVASRMLSSQRLRLMVYLTAGMYPLFLWFEAARLPIPLFRLALSAAAGAGLLVCVGLSRRSARATDARARTGWILAIGAAVWGIILAAEVLGFYVLARWILHATLTSALMIFLVAFLVVLARGAIQALLRIEARGRWRFLGRVGVPFVERLVLLLQVGLVIGVVLVLLDVWELTASPLESWRWITAAGVTVAGIEITLGRLLLALLMVYLAVLVSWLVRSFVESEAQPRWELDRGVGESINTLVHYFLMLAGVFFALGVLGVQLQNFAIIAGALGVGIGFGLQNVVNNFVSGLILLFERPVRAGDTVVVGGEWGIIKKIGLRSTVLVTPDQSELIVPNGNLVSETVTNWTLSTAVARLVISVGAAYGSDVDRVLRILREAATIHPAVIEDPPPQSLFMEFGASSLDFELRVWVRNISMRLEVRSAVLAEVDRRFREAGIEIPFPQRDLHLRSLDPQILGALRAALPADGGDGRPVRPDQAPAEHAPDHEVPVNGAAEAAHVDAAEMEPARSREGG